MAGRFITLEGGEGAGKSTQLKYLADRIRARGHQLVETREPGGSPGAEAIRALLLEGTGDRWTPPTEALLFAAARADHVERTIRPALAEGKWVLCDRFVDSSIAYQGAAGGVGIEAIRALHAIGSAGLLPHRTLLLQLPAEASADRARRRDGDDTDRIGARDDQFHAAVAASFANLALVEPARFRTIDAAGTPAEVTDRLVDALEDLL